MPHAATISVAGALTLDIYVAQMYARFIVHLFSYVDAPLATPEGTFMRRLGFFVADAPRFARLDSLAPCKADRPDLLCRGFPNEFGIFLNYCRALRFDKKPFLTRVPTSLVTMGCTQPTGMDDESDMVTAVRSASTTSPTTATCASCSVTALSGRATSTITSSTGHIRYVMCAIFGCVCH